MLNKERVILMTKLASYENGEGKKNAAIGKYFRGDYIGAEVVKSIIAGTLAFGVGFALYVLYEFESLMADIYKMDLFVFAKNILVVYVVVVVAFALITYLVYYKRYSKAQKSLRNYQKNLKKLSSYYQKDSERKA